MPARIAVAGKGGTGKTTLSALITTYFVSTDKTPILAVDADPNANLNEALGVEYDRSVVDTIDEIMNDGAAPAGVTKSQLVEYQVHDSLVESKGFDLLVMGHTEGPGCYCHANDLLRAFLDKLASSYKYVLMDNEAGMEHLSRRTTRDLDALLLVANPTATSLRSADRIHKLVQKLKLSIKKNYLVLNHMNAVEPTGNGSGYKEILEGIQQDGLPLLGEIPYDPAVAERSMAARGVMDLPTDGVTLRAVGEIVERLDA
ncbi:MAG: AAA family ATPase [Candidatus Latescibacteria bacterium]|jgi:CO dehydrogenase maturation factor|nr:AAA family ATPase [Candidatus Latescibacterota bacterium]